LRDRIPAGDMFPECRDLLLIAAWAMLCRCETDPESRVSRSIDVDLDAKLVVDTSLCIGLSMSVVSSIGSLLLFALLLEETTLLRDFIENPELFPSVLGISSKSNSAVHR